jgi:hypothetical protein
LLLLTGRRCSPDHPAAAKKASAAFGPSGLIAVSSPPDDLDAAAAPVHLAARAVVADRADPAADLATVLDRLAAGWAGHGRV